MIRFDRVLITPGRAELERTLTEAAAAANKGCRARLLHWAPADTNALLLDCAASPEGFRQWNGEGERKQRGFSSETRSAVAVVWWTDRLKRLHYRVAADRVYAASYHTDNLISPYAKRPPLWLVYPENLCFREEGKDVRKPLAICRCGMMGDPKALGWMGRCCAACHDRAEAGETAPVPPGEPARRMFGRGDRWASTVVFSADGRHLVYRHRCGTEVFVCDLETGETRQITCRHQTYSLAVSPNGTIAVGDSRGEIMFHSLTRPEEPGRLLSVPDDNILGRDILDLAFSPDGSLLAIAPYGRAELWSVDTEQRVVEVVSGARTTHSSRHFAFSPDGQLLATVLGGSGVHLWDVSTGRDEVIAVPDISYPDVVAFSSDGRTLAVLGAPPGAGALVDLATRRDLPLPGVDRANDVVFSPDGRLLAVAGRFGSLRLHDAVTGQPLASFVWHTQSVNSVAFSPDGRWLASASDDGFVKLWPVEALRSSPGPVPTSLIPPHSGSDV
jgi:hypothetical protein